MEIAIVCFAALCGSALTFFSGFGLGTILLPVFALFFPVELAISFTAIVHFLNNVFKLLLVGREADLPIAVRFGVPALLASFAGALLLTALSTMPEITEYRIGGATFQVTPVKLIVACVLLFFVLYDLIPRLAQIRFSSRHMIAGGLLSGFFGGLSGTQGALRSAFLIKAGLSKEAYIATGVVIACLVDIARLFVYTGSMTSAISLEKLPVVAAATLSAFVGAFAGSRLLKKVTLRGLQVLVAILLLIFSVLLGAGII